MENRSFARGFKEPHVGPLAGPVATSRVKQLSKARAKILELLVDGPMTVSSIAALTGQHENTIREHLDALVGEVLAIKYRSSDNLRGRPAWVYRKTEKEDQSRYGEYSGLLKALAGSIARRSTHPTDDAVSAGIEWTIELLRGVELDTSVRKGKIPRAHSKEVRRKVIALLSHLGFEPTSNASLTRSKLHRCPLLDAARYYPDIICNIHLGLVRGALAEFGTGDDKIRDAVLHPFAEPGACLLLM